jgi:hypothetical protein
MKLRKMLMVVDFSGAIGAEQTVDLSGFDPEVERIEGRKPLKFFVKFTASIILLLWHVCSLVTFAQSGKYAVTGALSTDSISPDAAKF